MPWSSVFPLALGRLLQIWMLGPNNNQISLNCDHYRHRGHYRHQSKPCSSEQSSENSVDLAAPIVSALQAPPTKAQVRKALESWK